MKTIIYLDNSTLSHIASAQIRGDHSSSWLTLYDELRSTVAQNVICCPSSPVVDHESELSERLARAVREVSRSLGEVRFRYPAEVQEHQLLRAFHRYLDGEEPRKEFSPPFSDVSDDDPHQWPDYLRFNSIFFGTPDEIVDRREGKTKLRNRVEEIFDDYAKRSLSFEKIRRLEASGVGKSFRAHGPLWRFLSIARRRLDPSEALETVDRFLRSEHAAMTPAADVTSRLYALVATSFSSDVSRRPAASDAYDIGHIGSYLPYVDILIADRFFAQRANESIAGLKAYRGKIYRLGEKQVGDFIELVKHLCRNAAHAELAEKVYREVGIHGSARRLVDRVADAKSAASVSPNVKKHVKSSGHGGSP